jgi:hypothetical protein
MSRAYLIRLVQEHVLSTEIALLRVGRALPKGSKLEKLNAFLEVDKGILRAGGRLSGSALHSIIDIHLFLLMTPLIVNC